MREALRELFVALEETLPACRASCERADFVAAQEHARDILSAGSKLHARLVLLRELHDDAQFVAEVDRALARERKGRNTPPASATDLVPLPFDEEVKPRKSGKGKPPA